MQQLQRLALVSLISAVLLSSAVGVSGFFGFDSADAQKTKKDKVKPEKATNEKDEKVKQDKSKEKAAKEKKAKQPKQARFEVIIDGSQVGNLTDAAANYDLTVSANGLTSKAKQLEIPANDTELDISNMMVVFNAKGMPLSTNDTFTATATSLIEGYVTDTVTGTLSEEVKGKSGKTQIVGSTDEALVFADKGEEVEEEIPDDFAQE